MRLLLLFILLIPVTLFSQNRVELEKHRARTLKEIEETESILTNVKQSKIQSIDRLNLLEKKISLRNQLIQNLSDEVCNFDSKISDSEKTISSLGTDIKKIKAEYARMIYLAYNNRSHNNPIMFLLSSRDFNQAYKRLKYLNQYSDYRKRQVETIRSFQKRLGNEVVYMDSCKNQKLQVLSRQRNETKKLLTEQDEKAQYITSLKTKEVNLSKKLKDRLRLAERLEQEVQKLIKEEIEKAKALAAAREKAKKEKEVKDAKEAQSLKNKKQSIFTRKNKTEIAKVEEQHIPEKQLPDNIDELLSASFKDNRGKLPWPIEHGVVTRSFGEYHHPIYKDVIMKSNGIDISTSSASDVRAIFDGVVRRAILIPGFNYVVIIKHGNFYTLYQNLVDVRVKVDDKVKSLQAIGRIATDGETRSTVLHIEISEDFKRLDPEIWLKRN